MIDLIDIGQVIMGFSPMTPDLNNGIIFVTLRRVVLAALRFRGAPFPGALLRFALVVALVSHEYVLVAKSGWRISKSASSATRCGSCFVGQPMRLTRTLL